MPLMIAGALGRATSNYLDESRKRRREDEAYNIATQDRTREAEEREGAQRLMMDIAPLATMPPEQRRQKAAELSGNVQTGKYKLSPQVAASVVAQLQSTVQGMEQADRETEKQRSEAARQMAQERNRLRTQGVPDINIIDDPTMGAVRISPDYTPPTKYGTTGGMIANLTEGTYIPPPEKPPKPKIRTPLNASGYATIRKTLLNEYMALYGIEDAGTGRIGFDEDAPHNQAGISLKEYLDAEVERDIERLYPNMPEIGGDGAGSARAAPKPSPPAQEPWRYDVMGRGRGPIAPPAMPQIAAPAQVAPVQTPIIGQQPAVVTPQDTAAVRRPSVPGLPVLSEADKYEAVARSAAARGYITPEEENELDRIGSVAGIPQSAVPLLPQISALPVSAPAAPAQPAVPPNIETKLRKAARETAAKSSLTEEEAYQMLLKEVMSF